MLSSLHSAAATSQPQAGQFSQARELEWGVGGCRCTPPEGVMLFPRSRKGPRYPLTQHTRGNPTAFLPRSYPAPLGNRDQPSPPAPLPPPSKGAQGVTERVVVTQDRERPMKSSSGHLRSWEFRRLSGPWAHRRAGSSPGRGRLLPVLQDKDDPLTDRDSGKLPALYSSRPDCRPWQNRTPPTPRPTQPPFPTARPQGGAEECLPQPAGPEPGARPD